MRPAKAQEKCNAAHCSETLGTLAIAHVITSIFAKLLNVPFFRIILVSLFLNFLLSGLL